MIEMDARDSVDDSNEMTLVVVVGVSDGSDMKMAVVVGVVAQRVAVGIQVRTSLMRKQPMRSGGWVSLS
jgi:hypothetical protein